MANNSNAQESQNDKNTKNMGEMNNNARNSSPSFNNLKNQYQNSQLYNNIQGIKQQAKKTVIKEGIKKAAQAYGVPEIATEKVLESKPGREILDAATVSDSPTESAVAVTKVITKQALISMSPALIFPLLLLIIIFVILAGKDVFSGLGDANDIYSELRQEIASVTSNYRSKVKIDGNLILATLVAYNDNAELDEDGINVKNIDYMKKQVNKLAAYQVITNTSCGYDSSTIRNIANNDDWFSEANYNCIPGMEGSTYTLSINEGNYNDNTSGSAYYWNLIDDNFIFDYYNEFMINTRDNTSENEEKINEIISEIYLYYAIMDDIDYGTKSLCSNGITLDGVTMNFEDYVKGVVYSNVINEDMSLEAMKALAVTTRSMALSASNNCTKELHSSTSNLVYQEGYETNTKVIQAVKETSGQYLSYNGDVFDAIYTTFPDLSSDCNVVCDANYCSADFSYDNTKTLGTHRVTVLRIINGIDIANDGIGSCTGMSSYAMEVDSANGLTYKEILEKYYSNSVEISISGGEGLVNENGFLKRVERAQRDNLYYYTESTDYNNGYIAGGLEGECAWYAVKRTNEIIATMGLQDTYNYVSNGGNGNDFCYAADYQQVDTSTNPNDPTLTARALIS